MGPFLTPDGIFRVDFEAFEMRMSHTVCNPRVTHLPSGEVLLDCFNTMDDGAPSVDPEGRLHLAMRTYPGSQPGWEIIYDAREGTVTQVDAGKSETFIHQTLIRYATRPRAAAPPSPPSPPPPLVQKTAIPAPVTMTVPLHDPSAIRDLPRWVGIIYPLIFFGALPALVLAAWFLSRTSVFSWLPRLLAEESAEFVLGAALVAGGFGFMLWLYRRHRV